MSEVWHLSSDGENYALYDNYSSREEAIAAGLKMFQEINTGQKPGNDLYPDAGSWLMDDPTFYVGKQIDWWPTIDEDDIIERLQMEADDFAGEWADGWLDVSDKYNRDLLRQMLQDAFDAWMKKTKNEPYFFMVEQTEEIDPRKYGVVQ